MKIRGDLKVLRDLVIHTAADDAKIGKLLYAADAAGTVEWSNLKIMIADNTVNYNKGELVTDDTGKKVYIASVSGAPGINLGDSRWTEITGGSSGGGGNIYTYTNKSELPPYGEVNAVYIVENTGSLYVWNVASTKYVFSGGGTTTQINATVNVGGIKKNDPVPAGSDLNEFIRQLVSPDVKSDLTRLDIHPGVLREVGESLVVISADIAWTLDSDGNVPFNMAISGEEFSGATFPSSGTAANIVASGSPVILTIPGSKTWVFSANDKNSTALQTKSDTVYWKNRMYFGNADGNITEVKIKAFDNILIDGSDGTFVFPTETGKYKWFCIVSSEAQPVTIKDADTGLNIAMYENNPISVAITNDFQQALTLLCYRSKEKLGGDVTVIITN